MKSVFWVLLLASWCWFPTPVRADFWLKPELGTQWGTTDFELQLEQRSATRDVKVRSLLEWPVDFVLAGVELGTSSSATRLGDAWLFEARLNTSLGNARGKMIDSDWLSSRSDGIPPTLFAYTKSKTESFALLGDLSVGYRFGRMRDSHHLLIDVLAGGRLEYYALTALGAVGKYLDETGEFRDVVIADDVEAAVYTVYHVLPFVGSRVVYRPLAALSFPITARMHALLSYSHDDHVLRNKDAYGRAYGVGVSGSAAAEYEVVTQLTVGLSAELYYLTSLTGVLEQKFYDNDPGTPGDERDSSIPDSDFAVESLRFQGMVFSRLTF